MGKWTRAYFETETLLAYLLCLQVNGLTLIEAVAVVIGKARAARHVFGAVRSGGHLLPCSIWMINVFQSSRLKSLMMASAF